MDTIFYNGKIKTMDSHYPLASAVAVKDGLIAGDWRRRAPCVQNADFPAGRFKRASDASWFRGQSYARPGIWGESG